MIHYIIISLGQIIGISVSSLEFSELPSQYKSKKQAICLFYQKQFVFCYHCYQEGS